jgi:hypothetical protein
MSNKLDLFSIYSNIEQPKNYKEINFSKVCDFEGFFVGKNSNNLPVIFFKAENFNFSGMPNEKFSNIKISRGINYNILLPNETVCGPFFSFELVSGTNLISPFFKIIEDLILFFVENSNKIHIKSYFNDIEHLFDDVVEILDDEVVGLFGELLLIYTSSDINRMIDFWHLPLNARFDFSSDEEKIEVKSTSSSVREHHISLEQVQSSVSDEVLLCSIMCRCVHHGEGNNMSINDLVTAISAQLSVDNLEKFNLVISEICKSLEVSFKFRDFKFDLDYSINSMMFFDCDVLPKIDITSLPVGVSNVKFKETLDSKFKLDISKLSILENNLFSVTKFK